MMKILIAYYSRTGHTEKAVQQLEDPLRADVVRIEERVKKTGPFGFLRLCYTAFYGRPMEILPVKIPAPLDSYDLVILAGPVWAWRAAPPLKRFVEQYGRQFRRTAYLLTQGGSKPAKSSFEDLDHCVGIPSAAAVAVQADEPHFLVEVERFLETVLELAHRQDK